MTPHRKAVSIALTPNRSSSDVFLVERNPKLRFFGGYFAFPGGTIDESDSDVELLNADHVPEESRPFIVAAAREVFEETGIFLARGAKSIPKAMQRLYRKDLLAEELAFNDLLIQEKQAIDALDFHFIGTLLTPEFAPVRYDTQFYWVEVPKGQQPEILSGELVRGDFLHAEAALADWRSGKMFIVPPVIAMLSELAGSNMEEAASSFARKAEDYQQGAIHQIYFTPGVQMMPLKTRTLPPAQHTNAYLAGEKFVYLIDPAPTDTNEQTRLYNYLDRRLAEGQAIKSILLTHHHPDHTGALAQCQARYKLPAFAHEETIKHLPDVDFAGALSDGDVLDLGQSPDGKPDWKLRVYHTPGHAPGHLIFVEDRYNSVIAGDLVSTLSTILISPPEGHMATYMGTLQRIAQLDLGTIYPSHGPAVKNGRKLLKQFIQHRLQREQKTLNALTRNPQTIKELVRKVYDDVNPVLWPISEQSLQAGLIKLIEEGRCAEQNGGYVFAGKNRVIAGLDKTGC